tara:strand:+ start:257 stop:391 length:135 start_codon:yes stop_codon:yes gene_type:complete
MKKTPIAQTLGMEKEHAGMGVIFRPVKAVSITGNGGTKIAPPPY